MDTVNYTYSFHLFYNKTGETDKVLSLPIIILCYATVKTWNIWCESELMLLDYSVLLKLRPKCVRFEHENNTATNKLISPDFHKTSFARCLLFVELHVNITQFLLLMNYNFWPAAVLYSQHTSTDFHVDMFHLAMPDISQNSFSRERKKIGQQRPTN